MDGILYLLIAAVISYTASLQLGPVNLRVIQATIEHNRRYALLVGIGGSLPEIIYAGIAFYITDFFAAGQFSQQWISYVTIPLFLFLTVINYRKPPVQVSTEPRATPHAKGFLQGFCLAMFNPQLITFWLIIITFLKTKNMLVVSSLYEKSMFVAGCCVGALFLQLTFIALVSRYKEQIVKRAGVNFNKLLAGLFLLMAVVDIVKLIQTFE